MAGDDGDTNRLGGDRDAKGIWVTMGLMEERLERKIDSKIDSLAKEMKQLLAENLQSDSTFHTPYLDQNRVFPQGRNGGRGSQWGYNGGRGSHLGFQGGRSSHNGFVEGGHPSSP